jgi:hypothetical protein
VSVVRIRQVIDRPVGDVFNTVIDEGNFAAWNPTIKSANSLPVSRAMAHCSSGNFVASERSVRSSRNSR